MTKPNRFMRTFTTGVGPLLGLVVWMINLCPIFGDELPRIRVSADSRSFVAGPESTPWRGWGANYDHDDQGRLIEDYWDDEWGTIEQDFREMSEMGLNVVRIHLQFGKFMRSPTEANPHALDKLRALIALADKQRLYLDLTGLGCYHKADVPPWYDKLSESARWQAQEMFWKAVASASKGHSAVFCYDLMNEPILPGDKEETEWLGGELGGKFFVQRVSLGLKGRSRDEVAGEWVSRLAAAIRSEDSDTLITVGEIPWATVFKGAKSPFHSDKVGKQLDFVSVHFYPKKGKVDESLEALAVYELGKPLVVEEFFPLECGETEAKEFIKRSSDRVDAWTSFYWGATPEENRNKKNIAGAITAQWLEALQSLAAEQKAAIK